MKGHIEVMPPLQGGGRRVVIDGAYVGTAYGMVDLLEFLRRAGLDPDSALINGDLIDWRGAGPDVW
jgi:hypothetical protein